MLDAGAAQRRRIDIAQAAGASRVHGSLLKQHHAQRANRSAAPTTSSKNVATNSVLLWKKGARKCRINEGADTNARDDAAQTVSCKMPIPERTTDQSA
jgi:hypothetical protein